METAEWRFWRFWSARSKYRPRILEDDLEKLDDNEIEQLMQEIKSRTVH